MEYRYLPYRYEQAMARFYIRFDYKTSEHVFFTPFLLVLVLSVGGVLTLLTIVFGWPARLSNMLANDTPQVIASLESYIAAVAWGDTQSAQVFARQLRWRSNPAQARWWRVFERKK